MNEIDKEILRIMQDNISLVSRPFLEVANKLRIGEEEVINRVQKMVDDGIVRRFSASIRHRKLGITANPICVWRVPKERVEEVGKIMAGFEEVTHCYERAIVPGKWERNLYAVIHGYSREKVEKIAEKISKSTGIKDYELIYSTKEFKKIYKRYG